MRLKLIILITIVITSCSQIRHYRRVVIDTHRDNTERALLSKAWHDEFPNYKDSTFTKSSIDSSDYNRFIENENILLQQVIDAWTIIDSLRQIPYVDSSGNKVIPPPKCIPSPGDSARFVQNYLRKRQPPPVNNNTSSETPIKNDSRIAELEKSLIDCRNEKSSAIADRDKVSVQLSKLRAADGWKYGGGLLLAIIAFVAGLLMRKKSLV